MSDHPYDISKHIRGYLIIGGTLIVGTVLTVLASYVDLGHSWNIGLPSRWPVIRVPSVFHTS